MYFVMDSYSRMVTGMYVGLEGPSWAGAMMEMCIRDSLHIECLYQGEYYNPLFYFDAGTETLYGEGAVSYTHLDVYKRQDHVRPYHRHSIRADD